MQITFDTNTATATEIVMIESILDDMKQALVIKPADNPAAGREPTIGELSQQLQSRVSAQLLPEVPALPPAAAVFTAAAEVPPALPDPAVAFSGVAVAPIPPAPPVVSAASPPPSAPGATAVVPPAGVDVDSRGLPWDARIHSSSKEKNKGSGEWRAKRGLNDAALVGRIEAELKAAMALPNATPGTMPAPPLGLVPQPPVAPPPAAAPPAAPPAGQPADPNAQFAAFMAEITPLMSSGKLTFGLMNEVLQKQGFTSLPMLITRPDLIPQVRAALLTAVGVQV